MKYYFDIEERLVKRVSIEAPSEEAAVDAVSALYHNQMIVLDSEDDFESYNIRGVDCPDEKTVSVEILLKKRPTC